ncbi:hypothetical protein DFH08DRAFT_1082179 [Mycena albidolilacea]|uniref:Uncharacterized protein n=1 Tax=Mycena albidolilacea TaxID=1033008 RepID=A0AAD6ZVX6_9AGAR|nr:hypothetical protein DFH08DRAFT_1082179 [Mycena albidolilacea]
MKPEQLGPDSYTPSTAFHVEFQFKWRAFRVNPHLVGEFEAFPFRFDLQQNRFAVRFIEFRSPTNPPPDIGNPGDIWLNVSPASYALFTLNANEEWLRWPGPTLDKERLILHPYLPIYALWCTIKQASWYHRDKLPRDWVGEKLMARQALGGYASVEEMGHPAASVRLILLGEGMEENKTLGDAVAQLGPRTVPSIDDQLKSALGDLPSSSKLPNVQEALVATLSSGIDYLLTGRNTLSRALSDAKKRAAIAEQQLERLNISNNHIYPPTPPPSSPPFPRQLTMDPGRDSDNTYQPSGTREDLDTVPYSASITSKHLDILFRPGQEGRSKHCCICLALVAYQPDKEHPTLLSHAFETHPSECRVFAGVSDEQLEVYRLELA